MATRLCSILIRENKQVIEAHIILLLRQILLFYLMVRASTITKINARVGSKN